MIIQYKIHYATFEPNKLSVFPNKGSFILTFWSNCLLNNNFCSKQPALINYVFFSPVVSTRNDRKKVYLLPRPTQ